MNTFARLNMKEHNDIVIVNAPESFEREIASLKNVTVRPVDVGREAGRVLSDICDEADGSRFTRPGTKSKARK